MTPSKDLVVQDLHAWQGTTPVLRGVNLTEAAGQTVALLGRNGSGRSTNAQALMGLVRGQVVALDSPEAVRADPAVQAAYWQAEART
jgi:branched-chain amino acid transport system ATP-binding protein